MKKVMFRTAISGFNKSDVNDYIAGADARHSSELAECQAKVVSLETEYELQKSLYEKQISELKCSLENQKNEYEAKAAELEQKVEVEHSHNEGLKAELDQYKGKYQILTAENVKLKSDIHEIEARYPSFEEIAELQKKAEAYESEQLDGGGFVRYGIEAEAENVIISARTEAATIRRNAKRENALTLEEAKKQVRAELSEIYTMMQQAAEEEMQEVLSCLHLAEVGVGQLGSELNNKNNSAVRRMEERWQSLESFIDGKFDELKDGKDALNEFCSQTHDDADKIQKESDLPVPEQPTEAKKVKNTDSSTELTDINVGHVQVQRRSENTERSVRRKNDSGFFRFGQRKK